ncbi:prenyltransferase/squalene oxidase repeat-containing protein [Actinomadura alba]|uniref:prenyltransferase/squalene oxidase repeat-containing protein n=1 Tax=Actinomadura alba TaxID=406431 RepID=UPI001C9CD7D0|nr:prenyltransferase/squalene oxidase repeat-containing protein [Actinomadura alba]
MLESALALMLMARTGFASPARDRLLGFLQARQDAPQELEGVLATLAVGRATGRAPAGDAALIGKLTDAVLGAAPGFISARRRMMVYAVLSVLGCPLPPDAAPTADGKAPTDPMHSWAVVQQAAVTLILAAAAEVSNEATAAALSTLTATDPATTVWEGYVLMHLLTLHGLAGVPGQEATVRSGLETLLRYQRGDGGFPFIVEIHNWCTSTTGLSLAAAGAPPDLLRAMAGMLAAHQGGAKRRSLSRGLSRGTPLSGGWSMSPNVALNDVDCTSSALELLHATDPAAFGGAVRLGVDALLAVQGADGGFPTYVAGAASEPCMTAAAINALAPHSHTAPARERALAFLADSQLSDGGFEPGWSRSRLHTIFRARLAACTAGPHDRRTADMAERIERTVRETQNADGGWGMQPGDPSDDISTAYGLITLCYGTDPRSIGRAMSWLLAHQNADGGYGGPPDMVGPRPFPYHIPILTDAPVLLAFGHVRSRVQGAASLRRRAS